MDGNDDDLITNKNEKLKLSTIEHGLRPTVATVGRAICDLILARAVSVAYSLATARPGSM